MQPSGDPQHQPELPPAQDPFAAPQPVTGDPYQAPYVDPYQTPFGYPVTQYGAPQHPGPGYPGYPGYPTGQHNAYGILSLILGILSLPMMCCWGSSALFGIPAVVLGIVGIRMARRGTANNKGLSIAGLACGAVGAVVSIAFWTLLGLGQLSSTFGYFG